ncbi:hypothetical protein KAU43_05795 [candidate division WOR-3 bacterium]|nr:hypothetical protein [candidate division WOR-3 bacterium]
MNRNRKWHLTNIIIIFSMIITPMVVLASVPTSTSFDRQNTYVMDGFRDGGYYAERQNPAITGYMNMSHISGTNEFNITTYNINNITLDIDLMFERRKALFGWGSVSWEDMVSSLGNDIVINIDSADGINELRFVDNPDVMVQVYKNDEIYQVYGDLQGVEIEINPLESGQTQILLKFDFTESTYDLLYSILVVIIILGIVGFLIRIFKRALWHDGTYYKQWGEK